MFELLYAPASQKLLDLEELRVIIEKDNNIKAIGDDEIFKTLF